MITSNDLRKGMTIVFEGNIQLVVDFEHAKMANRRAVVRVKLKNLATGTIVEQKFHGKEALEVAILEKRELQYLYREKNLYTFMDPESSEQVSVDKEKIAHILGYLKDGSTVHFTYYKDEPIDISLPESIVLQVTAAMAGAKGDTVAGASKPVTLETGKEIQAPLFIAQGDMIRIDTSTGKYIERVQS